MCIHPTGRVRRSKQKSNESSLNGFCLVSGECVAFWPRLSYCSCRPITSSAAAATPRRCSPCPALPCPWGAPSICTVSCSVRGFLLLLLVVGVGLLQYSWTLGRSCPVRPQLHFCPDIATMSLKKRRFPHTFLVCDTCRQIVDSFEWSVAGVTVGIGSRRHGGM